MPVDHALGKSSGKGNPHKSTPPSSSLLPGPVTGPAATASPIAWLDDASLLPPGSIALTISSKRWSGADLSETQLPIVEASAGLTPRVQIANVPHALGSTDGAAGAFGTWFFSAKIGVQTNESGVKLAVDKPYIRRRFRTI